MKLSVKTAEHMAAIRTANLLNASYNHISSSITATYGARIELMTFTSQP